MLRENRPKMAMLNFFSLIYAAVIQVEHVVLQVVTVPGFWSTLLHARNANDAHGAVLITPANCKIGIFEKTLGKLTESLIFASRPSSYSSFCLGLRSPERSSERIFPNPLEVH